MRRKGIDIAYIARYEPELLSDERLKEALDTVDPKEVARALVLDGGPYKPHELKFIIEQIDSDPFEYDPEDSDMWRDDVLDKYADYIKNYYYKYKPEAKGVDSKIDTEETHIGPMAQDIEKVNPAAVKETPQGYKTVDTGRLALMNAGAIAELARVVKELKNGEA
ncbi:MAG: hypothetical protein Pg6A_20100 [Termitinemataceae bacterium]|nr:MAG: hypothetical protein Pg6A_20100 [Termitinemataceae bacterium]